MVRNELDEYSVEELEHQIGGELPPRELMLTVSLLFIPLVSVSGINVNIS